MAGIDDVAALLTKAHFPSPPSSDRSRREIPTLMLMDQVLVIATEALASISQSVSAPVDISKGRS